MGKDVRLYKAGGFFLEKMEEAVRKRLLWAGRMLRRQLGADGVSALMLVLQNGFALGWIAGEIARGKIGVADFTFYSGAVIQFTQFMNSFVQSYGIVRQCSLDVGAVREALAYLPEGGSGAVWNLCKSKGCFCPVGEQPAYPPGRWYPKSRLWRRSIGR